MEAHLPVCANRVDDTDYQLQGDHKNPLTGHGNTPVHLVVINNEELGDTEEDREAKSERGVGECDG